MNPLAPPVKLVGIWDVVAFDEVEAVFVSKIVRLCNSKISWNPARKCGKEEIPPGLNGFNLQY